MSSERPVVIAGAGPVGVVAALALARQGIAVEVFEAEARVNDSPRAATTHAATLEILENLGLVEEVTRRGLIEPKFRIWNREPREMIVELRFRRAQGRDALPLRRAVRTAQACHDDDRATAAVRHASVEFKSRLAGFKQYADRVDAEVETAAGTRLISGSISSAATAAARLS